MIFFARRRRAAASRVGKGCQWDGAIQAQGSLQIDGVVRGLVTVNGDITVSETGRVEAAEIRGHDITVQGVVKAHVYAEGKLTLGPTSRIEGNVIAGAIAVDPGAYYTGHLATYDSRTPFYQGIDYQSANEERNHAPTLETLHEAALEASPSAISSSAAPHSGQSFSITNAG
ncbi:MAG: polymer-forming cytoskeletal protein [Cyanobacteria bacterium J06632_3]